MDKITTFLLEYGDGNGNGDGNGDGDGNGNGYGNGYGYGDGNGDGDGYGDGYGYGDGNGDGDGYGDGNGYGNGDGNGYGFKLSVYKKKPVYYIDNIPCTFISVQRSCAKVNVIDAMTFQSSEQFVYKFNGSFAHGVTIKKAKEDAERKYYSSLGVDDALELFRKEFKAGATYSNSKFYQWHSILTGSCDSGKDLWMQQHNIALDGSMTTEEFVQLTKGAYGGDTIAKIKL